MKRILSALLLGSLCSNAGAETLDTLAEYGDAATANALSGANVARGFTNPAAGEYTITAGGTDFWAGSDHGSFIYDADTTQAGDFTAVVRIDNIGLPGETLPGEWGRTGLMARDAAGGTPAANAAYAGSMKKWGTNDGATFGLSHQWRDTTGGDTGNVQQDFGPQPGGTQRAGTPTWVSLHRVGSTWYASWAPDVAGAPGGWSSPTAHAATAATSGNVFVGLGHQNHNVNPQTSTASFSSFAVGGLDESKAGGVRVASLAGKSTGTQAPGLVQGSAFEGGFISGTPISGGAQWTVAKIGATVPGLVADIYLGGNPGNQAGVFDRINTVAPNGQTIIPNLRWTVADDPSVRYFNGTAASFATAVPGSFGGDQENYMVHAYGEIFIPALADRQGADPNVVLFKDGVDDYTYLSIDGSVLVDDNDWANQNGVQGDNPTTGSPIVALDVSAPKYDDGEWVTIQFIMAEGGGGDHGVLAWDATDANGNFPTTITEAFEAADVIAPEYFRTAVSFLGDESGDSMVVDSGFGSLMTAEGDRVVLLVDGRIMGSRDVVPEPGAALLSLLGLAFLARRRRR